MNSIFSARSAVTVVGAMMKSYFFALRPAKIPDHSWSTISYSTPSRRAISSIMSTL